MRYTRQNPDVLRIPFFQWYRPQVDTFEQAFLLILPPLLPDLNVILESGIQILQHPDCILPVVQRQQFLIAVVVDYRVRDQFDGLLSRHDPADVCTPNDSWRTGSTVVRVFLLSDVSGVLKLDRPPSGKMQLPDQKQVQVQQVSGWFAVFFWFH